jgi:hypothetical protein
MSEFIQVAGELIPKKEAADLVRMLYNDAKQIAGEFHGMNRSEKFRVNWPNEYDFAEANWKTFVASARQLYAERLADAKTPPADARKIHLSLVLQAMMAQGEEGDTRLQVAPGTQAFDGDRRENVKTLEKFGATPNFRAALRNGAAKFARMH